MFGKHGKRLRRNVHSGSSGNIVKQNGDIHAVGNSGVMLNKSALRCFVVVRSYEQQSVNAELLGILAHIYSVICVVRAGTCNYRNPSVHCVNNIFNNLEMFIISKRGRFARCCTNNNCIRSALNLIFRNPFYGFKVGVSVFKRCYQRAA